MCREASNAEGSPASSQGFAITERHAGATRGSVAASRNRLTQPHPGPCRGVGREPRGAAGAGRAREHGEMTTVPLVRVDGQRFQQIAERVAVDALAADAGVLEQGRWKAGLHDEDGAAVPPRRGTGTGTPSAVPWSGCTSAWTTGQPSRYPSPRPLGTSMAARLPGAAFTPQRARRAERGAGPAARCRRCRRPPNAPRRAGGRTASGSSVQLVQGMPSVSHAARLAAASVPGDGRPAASITAASRPSRRACRAMTNASPPLAPRPATKSTGPGDAPARDFVAQGTPGFRAGPFHQGGGGYAVLAGRAGVDARHRVRVDDLHA